MSVQGTWMIRAKLPNFNRQSITGENKIEPIESCESVKILSLSMILFSLLVSAFYKVFQAMLNYPSNRPLKDLVKYTCHDVLYNEIEQLKIQLGISDYHWGRAPRAAGTLYSREFLFGYLEFFKF